MVWWGGTGRCGKGRGGGGLSLVLSEKVNGHQVLTNVVVPRARNFSCHAIFRPLYYFSRFSFIRYIFSFSFLSFPFLSLRFVSPLLFFFLSFLGDSNGYFFFLLLFSCAFSYACFPPEQDLLFVGTHCNAHPLYYYNGNLRESGLATNWPIYVISWHRTRTPDPVVAFINAD